MDTIRVFISKIKTLFSIFKNGRGASPLPPSSTPVRVTEYQFVGFKPLNYCFEETVRFDVKALFARCPVSAPVKPGKITKEC